MAAGISHFESELSCSPKNLGPRYKYLRCWVPRSWPTPSHRCFAKRVRRRSEVVGAVEQHVRFSWPWCRFVSDELPGLPKSATSSNVDDVLHSLACLEKNEFA